MKTFTCYRGRFNAPTHRKDWDLPYQYKRSQNFDRKHFASIEKVEVTTPETINGQLTTLADVDMSHYFKGKKERHCYLPEYDKIQIKVLEQL